MPTIRKNILTIAGFDPTGGAGILADVKTFEQHKLQSFAIQTANTIQTEDKFISVNWVEESMIIEQLDTILAQYKFEYVKIGLIPSLSFLKTIIKKLKNYNDKIKIIWDPVLTSSSGFDFKLNLATITEILKDLYMITPNWNECKKLSGIEDSEKGANILAEHCLVYLKGGHNEANIGKDFLYTPNKTYPFRAQGKRVTEKHGSGCVLSSAIAANLLRGYPIIKACLRSKNYITRVLESTPNLLGYHKF